MWPGTNPGAVARGYSGASPGWVARAALPYGERAAPGATSPARGPGTAPTSRPGVESTATTLRAAIGLRRTTLGARLRPSRTCGEPTLTGELGSARPGVRSGP